MCIIVYKPADVPAPSAEALLGCWQRNPHGAGLMYPEGGKVAIRKGFMTWEDFTEAYAEAARERNLEGVPLALHFRIATHGDIKPGCCHPFAVTKDYAEMRAVELSANVGFMHNGTLGGLETSDSVSDSMAFARNVLEPLSQISGTLVGDRRVERIIAASTQDSRFLLMDGTGNARMFGRWFEDGGIYYSNNSFRTPRGPRSPAPPVQSCEQQTLFDAFCAFGSWDEGELRRLGLFAPCAECPMLAECAEFLPCCESEEQAAELAELAF